MSNTIRAVHRTVADDFYELLRFSVLIVFTRAED